MKIKERSTPRVLSAWRRSPWCMEGTKVPMWLAPLAASPPPVPPPRGQPKKEADEKHVVGTAQATEEQHGSSPGWASPRGG